MLARLAAILSLLFLLGCGEYGTLQFPPKQAVPVGYENPMLIRVSNCGQLWDGIHDVISDYFRIEHETIPMQLPGGTLVDGRIDAFPKPGATLLEPWDHDSADSYQRLESTLQSIRRYAVVKVHPEERGFLVEVAVYKELENLRQPEHSTAGSATFRNDITINRAENSGLIASENTGQPAAPKSVGLNQSWIPKGRDTGARATDPRPDPRPPHARRNAHPGELTCDVGRIGKPSFDGDPPSYWPFQRP